MIYPKSPYEIAVLMEDKQLIPNWKEEFKQAWEESREPEIFIKSSDPFSDINNDGYLYYGRRAMYQRYRWYLLGRHAVQLLL